MPCKSRNENSKCKSVTWVLGLTKDGSYESINEGATCVGLGIRNIAYYKINAIQYDAAGDICPALPFHTPSAASSRRKEEA
jgi:hypothetical protein